MAPEYDARSFLSYQHERGIFLHYRHVETIEIFHDDVMHRGWDISPQVLVREACMVVKTMSKFILCNGSGMETSQTESVGPKVLTASVRPCSFFWR